jgi:hypothetical protein
MKHIILKRNQDGSVSSEKMGSYEGPKDDSSRNRSYLMAEPLAAHLELPEGMDEDCVEPVEVDGVVSLQENADKVLAKRQAKANANLDAIRALREPLLASADHEINTMEDDGIDATAMRAYRKQLRECTDSLKKVSGSAKLSCENLVPSEFEFPSKP